MLVPNAQRAVVEIKKLTEYSLNANHEIGQHKVRIFIAALDLTAQDAEKLKTALLFAITICEAVPGKFDKYGQRYTVDFVMTNGSKQATIRSGWIIKTSVDFPRLTTCFVL